MALDFPNAPTNGQVFYGPNGVIWSWDGTKWTSIASTNPSMASGNVGRNLLHNPLFTVAQRGTGPFTAAGGYTLDRWLTGSANDTISLSQVALGDADRAAIGDEASAFALQNVFTGNAAAGAYNEIMQRVEGVRRLAGKPVTISFWAKAAAGTPKLGINVLQWFGSGGSPSAATRALTTGNAVTLSTTWARYSSTVAIPSASGKTLGTAGDDSTWLEIVYSSGASNNAIFGNIGVQSGTIQLWGVQLEIGSVATPLEKPDPRYDLANCQRFYCRDLGAHIIFTAAAAGAYASVSVSFPVTMRAAPTVTAQTDMIAPNNTATIVADNANTWGFRAYVTSNAAGIAYCDRTYTASADL